MAAGKDLYPVDEKPFYGEQKFIRCESCDIRFHYGCLKISDSEFAIYTASGKPTLTCEASTKLIFFVFENSYSTDGIIIWILQIYIYEYERGCKASNTANECSRPP
jgi:hypothetical protein